MGAIMERAKTIAEILNGQNEGVAIPGSVHYDPQTMIFTFQDQSQAKLITTFVDVEPFVSASLSTMSKKAIRVWKVC